MRTRITPLEFFAVVPLHSPYMLLALLSVGVLGTVTLVLDPSMSEQAIVPVVLLQMFAASTGFAVPARRGHLDLLLTGGATRVQVALTHLAISVLPGVVVWLALALVEAVVAATPAPRALFSGTLFAIATVSTLAWAVTVPLPRLSGGIGWLTALAIALAGSFEWRAILLSLRETPDPLVAAAIYLGCPFLLIGARFDPSTFPSAAAALGIALFACACAVAWIARMDVPLEAAQ